MPDFEEVISFGGGGAGGRGWGCSDQKEPNTIKTYTGYEYVELCIFLQKVDPSKPFRLSIEQSVGAIRLSSNNIWFDTKNKKLRWEGYPDWAFPYNVSGTKTYLDIPVSFPTYFFEGKWKSIFSQDRFQIENTFAVSRSEKYPSIYALDARYDSEIIPADIPHLLRVKSTGKVDVIGVNFPANVPVYILLYRETSDRAPYKYSLVQKQVVISNSSGLVSVELINSFAPGQVYKVFGLTDPKTPLGGSSPEDCSPIMGIPCDFFSILSVPSNSVVLGSCPGAPPQRMIVNQRGYVCTQSDRVRLRNAPAKSADTIVYVNTGTQFTVIGGPSCSDSWSWWKVRLSDGTTGWLAEGGDAVDPYFICPLQ